LQNARLVADSKSQQTLVYMHFIPLTYTEYNVYFLIYANVPCVQCTRLSRTSSQSSRSKPITPPSLVVCMRARSREGEQIVRRGGRWSRTKSDLSVRVSIRHVPGAILRSSIDRVSIVFRVILEGPMLSGRRRVEDSVNLAIDGSSICSSSGNDIMIVANVLNFDLFTCSRH